MLENKKIFILGMAKSGYSVAKLLASKNEIIITDNKDQNKDNVNELEKLGVTFIKTDNPNTIFDSSFNVLIKNPGIMPFHETVKKARKLNIPVINEMEVAYHYLPKNVTIIGVTGSNGKTTTTTMIYDLLKLMKKPVVLGGNIGYPVCDALSVLKEKDILLLEISDHQLLDFKDFKTNISVLTNLCPTHLDYHGNYENYKKAKMNIFNHHTHNDIAIINNSNTDCMELTKNIISSKLYFNGKNAYIKDNFIHINDEKILNINDIRIKGNHNYENIMVALLVVSLYDIEKDIITDYFKSFNGVEHRMEFVVEKNGVKYYNDSKATNPTSTYIAIDSFENNINLILGGMERKQDFHELDNVIHKVKKIYAIGQTEDRIIKYAKEVNVPAEKYDTLLNAMKNMETKENDIVLLSPASASWDQYDCFETRGDEFKKYCKL